MDILDLLDRLIAEHERGGRPSGTGVASLVIVLEEFDSIHSRFTPGRMDQGQELANIEKIMESVIMFLNQHFDYEENLLLRGIEEHGDPEMMTSFLTLIKEHEYLKTRARRVMELIQELRSGKLSYQHWNASANDLKAYLHQTRKLLENHAARETELFMEFRKMFLEKALRNGD